MVARRVRSCTCRCVQRAGVWSAPVYVVEVEERIDARLSRRTGTRYTAPPQDLDGARTLAALLLGLDELPEGDGPWRRPLAGGLRVVRLVAAPSA